MEDIANTFDSSSVSNDFVADIQFHVSGEEPGDYYFHVENKKCTFYEGIAESPKATIKAPSEVWEAILQGEMNPQLAFFRRKFTVEGDIMLLLTLASLFKVK
jgi:putative sterol carrier protein